MSTQLMTQYFAFVALNRRLRIVVYEFRAYDNPSYYLMEKNY